jgi:hypothetical protein
VDFGITLRVAADEGDRREIAAEAEAAGRRTRRVERRELAGVRMQAVDPGTGLLEAREQDAGWRPVDERRLLVEQRR